MGNAKEVPLVAAYLQKPFTRCVHCLNIVEHDGETVSEHWKLIHRHTGEASAICRLCHGNYSTRFRYLGEGGAWNEGKKMLPEKNE